MSKYVDSQSFHFDRVFPPTVSNGAIYDACIRQSGLLDVVFSGLEKNSNKSENSN